MQRRASSARDALVTAAGRLVRSRGAATIAVADIAAEAGVGRSVVYNHFASSDDLAALAVRAVFVEKLEAIGGLLDSSAGAPLTALGEAYLTAAHLDDLAEGCPAAALLSDAGRLPAPVAEAYAEGVAGLVGLVARACGDEAVARRAVPAMVGSLAMARGVARHDRDAALAMLAAARADLAARDAA